MKYLLPIVDHIVNEKVTDTFDIDTPDAPEAPIHLGHDEASSWQSGWESGYRAAMKTLAK